MLVIKCHKLSLTFTEKIRVMAAAFDIIETDAGVICTESGDVFFNSDSRRYYCIFITVDYPDRRADFLYPLMFEAVEYFPNLSSS